jgi:PKD repeat protein
LISDLSKTVGATFYVAPSTTPGTPGPTTTIDLPLYYQEAQDYMTSNPLVTEMTCTINLIGTDGAGHSITKSVTFDLPALQPGIDFVPPVAYFDVTPDPPTGTAPFTVVFNASKSTDNRGIASYAWDFGDGTSDTGVLVTHTYSDDGIYTVILTVTDFYNNKGYYIETITVGETLAEVIVSANPLTVSPGGSSTISAYCTDDSGNEVPDGTLVVFGTSFGTITIISNTTINGFAFASLKIDSVNTAIVLATTTYASGSVIVTCE